MNISSSPEEENKTAANYWRQSGALGNRGEEEVQDEREEEEEVQRGAKRRRRNRTGGRGVGVERFPKALQRSAGAHERQDNREPGFLNASCTKSTLSVVTGGGVKVII